jgi:SAM-dependent methyltransferase
MVDISRNQRYLLSRFERSGLRTGLDYGCGEGELVAAAVERGYDFWGTDPYYDDAHLRAAWEAETPEPARDRIKILGSDNTIPWPDETFDWICSGQVFEHVHDLDKAVSELARVTKRTGANLHNFPTVERVREPHSGVPFYGRVPPQIRGTWSRASFRIGLVSNDSGVHDAQEWWVGHKRWHDRNVVLRRRRELIDTFARYFDITDVSVDKLSFHLNVELPDVALLRFLEAHRHGTTLLMTRR